MLAPKWLEAPPYVQPHVGDEEILDDMLDLPHEDQLFMRCYKRHLSVQACRAHCLLIQSEQRNSNRRILPPCNRCGHPTHYYCQRCFFTYRGQIAHAVCLACQNHEPLCRLCCLEQPADIGNYHFVAAHADGDNSPRPLMIVYSWFNFRLDNIATHLKPPTRTNWISL